MAQPDRILGYFLEEAKDHLNTIEQGLRKLPETVKQPATIRELFRAAHSIKGSAAMLGLLDVQQVGNQFEANFKLLKEQPMIAVDNKLQNLFLESFSFLRASIEEVSASSDPYRRDPASPDPVGDPVFEELKSYLQQLLRAVDAPAPEVSEQSFSQDPAVEQVFGEYVTRKLGEITSLCLQSDTPDIRAQIQQICQKLGSLGDNFDFLEWTNLFTACRLAIANPHNTLHQLGESISIAVKQAQILILSDRHQAIGITPDLEALIDSPEARLHQHQNDSALPADSNLNTFKLDQPSDPFAGIPSQTGRPAEPESATLAPGLSSIYDRVQPLQFDGNDHLADFAAVPEAEFDTGAGELDDFMHSLLREDIPNDGTWMQDDEFSESDEFSLDFPLEENTPESFETARAGHFYEQIFEPSPEPLPPLPSSDQLEPSAAGEYEEATFFTPDFGDAEDPDIATFWSDSPFDQIEPQTGRMESLDLPASLGSQPFQPEQPLEPDLDISLPDFTLDDRSMSDLFPVVAATAEWTEDELSQASDPTASVDFTNHDSSGFGEIEPIEANDFEIDLQFEHTQNHLDPLQSMGTMDTVEQGLSTHEQAENSENAPIVAATVGIAAGIIATELSQSGHEEIATDSHPQESPELLSPPDINAAASDVDLGIDILADADASQDFADLDFSDSLGLEQLGGVDHQVADEPLNWHELIGEIDDQSEPFAIESAPAASGTMPESDAEVRSIDLEPVVAVAALDATAELPSLPTVDDLSDIADVDDLQADLSSSVNDVRDISHPTDSIIPSDSNPLLFENFDSSELPTDTASEAEVGELTGWLDSYSDLHKIDDFADLDSDELNSIESAAALSTGSDFADLELDAFNHSEPVADLSSHDDLVDLNFDELNIPEPIAALSFDRDPADLELDALNNSEPIADVSINDDFANLNFDEFNAIEPVAALSFDRDPADLELDALNHSEPVADLAINDDFANLNFDEFNDIEPIAAFSVDNDLADLELEAFNHSEPVASISENDNFADLDLAAFDTPESGSDPAGNDDFANLNFDELNPTEPIATLSISDDFANLDLDAFNSSEPIVDGSTSDDFADLDLSFNEVSTDLSNDEFANLGSILDANPESNLGMGDLDSLLLGTAAVGIGGAVVAASTFDDLDALMGSPSPANDLNDLDGLLGTPTPAVNSPAVKPVDEAAKPDRRSKQRTFEQTMRVSVRHLDNLNNLVGELVVNRNTLEQDQNRMRQFIEKLLSEVQKLNEVGKRMQDLYERSLMENSLIASRQQSKPQVPQSPANAEMLDQTGALMEYDPLEMDRFTPIHLLSQKMIELTVRVRESTADIEFVVDGSTEVTRTLRQITGQLQEDLTKSRMIPFAQTADRLQRGVRDNGLKYGKQVELSIDGRDTLIDKVILESLSDPLIHMVNNAIAHGIESPETRLAAGKPALGTISVRALHQGNQTIISIADDGAGINTEIVKTKAIEKGIITAQKALTMTKAEVYELLFLPSFSTKDQADELAGRGVGMDVVRTSLNDIRGTISTESQLGIGTTFTIRLPLALSIAKALIAVNNKNNIAFPMDGIEDTQDVSPEQIQTNSAGEQCIFWRDSLMPFKPLSDLLGFNRPLPRNNFYGTQEDDSDLVSILILRSDGNLIAVQVDRIIGDREIVIKPLQGPASKPLGIAGATVLGDGQIIPIADVIELIDLAKGTLVRHVSAQWASEMILPTNDHHESMVLIVDDSITVRELLSLTFKRAGYRVEQARDGQEAWDKLRAGLPCDIVFCDIEMPRMDGLEFLSRVQKDVALSKVPVAMLTSRGSDRHRQIAAQLGASGYFIKPYLEEALLDAAKRMIKGEVLAIV
jgi:chemotaxis protein histidine kinase CheA/ActR/RegA family two-component response regulator